MANMNLKQFNEQALLHGVTMQLIMGKAKNNVIGMLCGGYKFDRLGNFTKCEIENLMQEIACEGVQKAFENHNFNRFSVAKSKINEAHGRTRMEVGFNQLDQSMTYADGIKKLVQFKGRNMTSCLDTLHDIKIRHEDIRHENINEYKTWVQHVINWYVEDNKSKGLGIAKSVIMNGLKNKQFRIIDGIVYTRWELQQFMQTWLEVNGLGRLTDDKIEQIADAWQKSFEG